MQPKIYSFTDHQIPIVQVDRHAYYVIEKLRQQGFIAYLVGGSVRDLLLRVRPKDFDISTSAKPDEIKRIFRRNCYLIGRRFRLAHIRFGKKILEVSTFRSGDPEEETLIKEDNVWGPPEEDAKRRDFTLNGLFYDPETQNIIDYIGGFDDAKNKLLRAIGDPSLRFIQDPVRMIRLLKFRARFGFEIEEATLSALFSCKNEIVKSSPARILEELFRMLESGSSKEFFSLLQEHRFLSLLLPKFSHFLEEHDKVYTLLEAADSFNLKNHMEPLERPILCACLLYPFIEMSLNKGYNLGSLFELANKRVHEFFTPFFHFPKRIKIALVSILTHQFRIAAAKKGGRLRIPRDPYFPMALHFFKLRCGIDHSLYDTYLLWNEEYISHHKKYHAN